MPEGARSRMSAITASNRWRSAAMYGAMVPVTLVLSIWALNLFSWPWGVPLFYNYDPLSAGAQYKGVLETGWYENNPALGAPFGQNYHLFPIADNLQFVLVRLAGAFTDDWAVAANVVHVSGFALAAVCGTWFFRVVGLGRLLAFAGGLLFAFAPYHFIQGFGHLSLSLYFPVALTGALAFRLLVGESIFLAREGRRGLRWLTPRTLGTLGVLGVMGTTSSYYSVFTLLLLGLAGFVALLRRHLRAVLETVLGGAGLVFVMVVNMSPDLLYRGPHDYLSFERQPQEVEVYALKFAALILPTPWNRIGGLGPWRMSYEATFPLPSEQPVLGTIAAIGFVFLLSYPVLRGLAPGRLGQPSDTVRSLLALSGLTFVSFIFGIVGGADTLVALLVTTTIRAWNRISIFLMLFALAATLLLVQAGVRRVAARRGWGARRSLVAVLAASAAVTGFGLFDQVAPATWILKGTERQMWTTDQEFAAAIQARMPQGSMIVEMPYLDFPESQPINKMNDYDPVRPYLHSTGLRWTYGGIKGLPRSSWSARVVNQPPDRMLVAAAAAGASGLYIDRFGYLNENTSALEEGLRSGTGEEPLVSRDRRYAFFDIRGAARRIRTALGAARTRQLRSLVLNSPATFWQNDWQPAHVEGEADVQPSKGAAATLEIGNPGPARRFRLAFTVRVDGATTTQPVTIVWPDGLRQIQVVPAVDGYRLVRSFVLPHGPSRLSMSRADPGTLSLIEFRLRDPRRERLVNKALVASAE